jgi:hypothetical protein
MSTVVYNDILLLHLVMQLVREMFGVFINIRIFLIINNSTLHAQGKQKFVIVCVSWFFHLLSYTGITYSKSNCLGTTQDCCTICFIYLLHCQEQ